MKPLLRIVYGYVSSLKGKGSKRFRTSRNGNNKRTVQATAVGSPVLSLTAIAKRPNKLQISS